ncbi:DUF6415 family natural product biosynthesis protein [Streptomyces sp. YGL11-2]|uniref:DUF6415 family natural product biosynthesis protein n=1 Tax=Streptomyces sp. YGL11-2 TaxID=3414028 RepID=UPI003CF4EEE7
MTTTTFPSADPGVRIDAETISETIREALRVGSGRPDLTTLAALEEVLRGHVALLLTEAREMARGRWPSGCEVSRLTARLDGIERQMRQGLGDGALSAHVQVHQLARDCQWLLAHHAAGSRSLR